MTPGRSKLAKRCAIVGGVVFCAWFAWRLSPFWISPLTGAAMKGDAARVEQLIRSGASINSKSSMFGTDAFTNWTPLHWAAYRNHDEVVAVLLRSGADASAVDWFGRTALDVAFTGPSYDTRLATVRALLEGGADPNQGKSGTTPLHRAALAGNAATIELLLSNGAIIDGPDRQGCTALHDAVLSRKDAEIVKVLLQHGADARAPLPNGGTLDAVVNPKEQGSEVVDLVRQAASQPK